MIQHETDNEHCWCQPEVLQVCPECRDLDKPDPGCWRCSGRGLVPEYDEEMCSVIVHRDT